MSRAFSTINVLKSNSTSDHEETRNIRQIVDDTQRELRLLVGEISRAGVVFEDFYEKQRMIIEFIKAQQELLTPARRLYPDLLAQIFLRCIPDCRPGEKFQGSRDRERYPKISAHEAPLKLGHICRGWRQVALSTPPLWTEFDVNRTTSIVGLKQWLKRSGAGPLSFRFSDNYPTIDGSSGAMGVLAAHARRWKHVDLGFWDSPQLKIFLAMLSGGLPSLKQSK